MGTIPLFYCNNCGTNLAKWEVMNLSVMPRRKFYWCDECRKQVDKKVSLYELYHIPHSVFQYSELQECYEQPQKPKLE